MPLDRVPTLDAHAVPPAVGEVDRADEPARGVAAIAQEVGELGAPEPERIVCTVPAGISGVVLTRMSSTGNDVAHADRVVVEKLMLEENAVAAVTLPSRRTDSSSRPAASSRTSSQQPRGSVLAAPPFAPV